MKKLLIALLTMIAPSIISAQTQWTLQGSVYTVDTLFHAQIGPGTTQTSLKLSGPVNQRVFYTVTDLTNPYVDMRAVMANDKIASVTTVSNMAKAHNSEGNLYFAGVNADFFGNNAPIGTTVVDSEVYYASNNGWTHWALDENDTPHLGQMTIGGTVSNAAGTSSHTITGFNRARETDNLIIFTPKYGTTTSTNDYGAEAVLTPVDGSIALGKNVKMKVTGTPTTTGSTTIPAGGYVLSGHGTAKDFVLSLVDGEEITVNATLTLNNQSIAATQVLGGQPMILSGGVVLDTQGALDHLTAVNPRTAVGHDATGTKLVMLVVDGRLNTAVSKGCVSRDLADMMREVGCTEAMNFDGGGSSVLYTDALGVRNNPSDGNERSVTNSLFAVATSPTDNTIASIAFVDNSITLPKYGYYTPIIYGYNKYGVLINSNVQDYTLSCPNELGEITNNGTSLFANGNGYHALTASVGNITASIPVLIGTAEPTFSTDKVLVDSYTDYTVEVYATVNDNNMPLDNKALTWTSDDTSIATVDETGKIHGVKNGTTTVRGVVGDFSDEITVTVEIPKYRYQSIDPGLDASTWTSSGSGVKDIVFSALGEDGLAIDYTVSSTRNANLGAMKNIQIWSLPDSLLIDINPGALKFSKIMLSMASLGSGKVVTQNYTPTITSATVNRVLIPFSDMFDTADASVFPLQLQGMTFYLSGAKSSTSYRIEISKLQAVYTAIPPTIGSVEEIGIDSQKQIQLYPNPITAGDIVSANVSDSAQYSIYSANGALVKQGAGNKLATAGLACGVYIVTITDNGDLATARLIIK